MLQEYQFASDQEEEVSSDNEDASFTKEVLKEKKKIQEPVRY